MTKKLFLASFIDVNTFGNYYNYLITTLGIEKEKIFIFENLDEPENLILTFKYDVPVGVIVNLKTLFNNTIQIHKKASSIYTINALNRIIDNEPNVELGNINYKSYQLDWSRFDNKAMILSNNELVIIPIKRIFL